MCGFNKAHAFSCHLSPMTHMVSKEKGCRHVSMTQSSSAFSFSPLSTSQKTILRSDVELSIDQPMSNVIYAFMSASELTAQAAHF